MSKGRVSTPNADTARAKNYFGASDRQIVSMSFFGGPERINETDLAEQPSWLDVELGCICAQRLHSSLGYITPAEKEQLAIHQTNVA